MDQALQGGGRVEHQRLVNKLIVLHGYDAFVQQSDDVGERLQHRGLHYGHTAEALLQWDQEHPRGRARQGGLADLFLAGDDRPDTHPVLRVVDLGKNAHQVFSFPCVGMGWPFGGTSSRVGLPGLMTKAASMTLAAASLILAKPL